MVSVESFPYRGDEATTAEIADHQAPEDLESSDEMAGSSFR